MENKQLIEATKAFVKETLKDAEGGHDWFHIERVYNTSLLLAQTEPVAILVVSLGALLHDIADAKFYNGDEEIGPKKARNFLQKMNVSASIIEQVIHIVENISFKGEIGLTKADKRYKSPELKVVQDADRLDAMGAIGIARAFNYGGFKNRSLYDPKTRPALNQNKEAYKKSTAPTINHFYEKLLLLKDKMNTKTGKKLAEDRHRFMEQFLEQFYKEWYGKE